jgi:hypothetical protein
MEPGDDEKGEEQVPPWTKDLEAARTALGMPVRPMAYVSSAPRALLTRRRWPMRWNLPSTAAPLERLHRAELAACDVTIGYQQDRIAEVEREVSRLRTALQVLIG